MTNLDPTSRSFWETVRHSPPGSSQKICTPPINQLRTTNPSNRVHPETSERSEEQQIDKPVDAVDRRSQRRGNFRTSIFIL
mmetsp:Transcript_10185/g.23335  ORF Transcript_10185/g.23335 Transcript_10185/m.23335 type:complete len:81 (-) Transcript_10185:24-266(-)